MSRGQRMNKKRKKNQKLSSKETMYVKRKSKRHKKWHLCNKYFKNPTKVLKIM